MTYDTSRQNFINQQRGDLIIHIAIVEDEAFYVQQIQNYMERYRQESRREISVTVYSDGEDILDNYKGDYDIILMDIQMRFMDGMTAAKNIRKLDDAVVIMFITNMTQYAVQGYEVDALDYIIKPVEYFAFSQKLEKAVGRIRRRKRFYVTIPVEEGIQKLDVSSIYYIEARGHQAVYRTDSGAYTARAALKDLEGAMEQHGFYRCSKGYLVNMNLVEGISGGDCIIHGEKIPIGRSKKKEFMECLIRYMNMEGN